jgi:putative PIN family toxin of toxin-antitoxin system
VVDTNVMLVSASSKSPLHWIFQLFATRQHELCVTIDILLEYQEKFSEHIGGEKTAAIMAAIMEWPNLIRVNTYFNFGLIHKDPDDNKFVDCAIAASAYYIISEDSDFQVLKTIPFPHVNVLTISEFRSLVSNGPDNISR